jgi:hypothetical protein
MPLTRCPQCGSRHLVALAEDKALCGDCHAPLTGAVALPGCPSCDGRGVVAIGRNEVWCVACRTEFVDEHLGRLIAVYRKVDVPGQPRRGLRRAKPPAVRTHTSLHRYGGLHPLSHQFTTICGIVGNPVDEWAYFRPEKVLYQRLWGGSWMRCRTCHIDDDEIDRLIGLARVIQDRKGRS